MTESRVFCPPSPGVGPSLSRRGLLRAAAVGGGGLLVAACAPVASQPGWTIGPTLPPAGGPGASSRPSAEPSPEMSHSPSTSGSPSTGSDDHDANAMAVVKRYLDGEWELGGYGNQPLLPTLVVGVKTFNLTIDKISHKIDAKHAPVDALGYNGMWPGPRLEVVEGDAVRVTFKNNLDESTGVHFHGQRVPNPMDGVPHITQDPILPGASFTYEFTARVPGSHMYHSHHNATDQVGRGLLGAFIVQPSDPGERADKRYGVSQDIVWISNDSLGGFTINGRAFPATPPIVANLGDRVLVRFMNEGVMMHPWHLHGMPMRIVARDGYPLGGAAFICDTLGVNPGERWDAVIECEEPGVWAFHCHVLPHVEGVDGMFGMVTALIVNTPAARSDNSAPVATLVGAAAAVAGSTARLCSVPGPT